MIDIEIFEKDELVRFEQWVKNESLHGSHIEGPILNFIEHYRMMYKAWKDERGKRKVFEKYFRDHAHNVEYKHHGIS